jgi:hypothetical protein
MVKLMEKEVFIMQMVKPILDIGKMIIMKEKVEKRGLIILIMMEIM